MHHIFYATAMFIWGASLIWPELVSDVSDQVDMWGMIIALIVLAIYWKVQE